MFAFIVAFSLFFGGGRAPIVQHQCPTGSVNPNGTVCIVGHR